MKVVHRADPARAMVLCGANGSEMYTYFPENVTCKKCLRLMRAKVAQ